jgi:hypothetical protein
MIISREKEEQCMRSFASTCCRLECVTMKMFGRLGAAIHADACVLCNRADGPGYYSLFDDYCLDDLRPSDPAAGRHGASVRFRLSDYRPEGQTLSRPALARTMIHSMYNIVEGTFSNTTFFKLHVCLSGARGCSNNNHQIVSIVDRRFGRGLVPKRGALDCITGLITCLRCLSPTTAFTSDEHGHLNFGGKNYTRCLLCRTITTHPGGYISAVFCYGCQVFCSSSQCLQDMPAVANNKRRLKNI